MKVLYSDFKTEKVCYSLKEALRYFGGNKKMAESLLSRINAMKHAAVIKDIIATPSFHFHNLKGKRKGFFAIDVKTRKDKWRIIFQPLDENENPFDPCNIDVIADTVKIVEISEVSAHYE